MSSESPNIAFEFRDDSGTVFLKIRPRSMRFERDRGKLDFCQAEFSQEVADEIRPTFEETGSVMRQPLSVLLYLDGDLVYRLLYVPDGVRFTDNAVHIQFHDVQKYLTRGKVDWRRENVKLEEAYRHVFEQRNTSGPKMFEGIKFTVPEESYDELLGYDDSFLTFGKNQKLYEQFKKEDANDEVNGGNEENSGAHINDKIRDVEEENVYNIIDGHYAIDFDKISPWKCIKQLNEKFGVDTWVNPSGYLMVGSRTVTGFTHAATPNDSRVWKLSEYNITPPRDPVIASYVRGGWAADPTEDWEEEVGEILTLNRGTKDFRVEGVATRTNVEFGQEITAEVNAKKDALQAIAERLLIKKQTEQWSGTIDILPSLSGETISDIRYVSVGDRILTIPPDGDRDEDSVCDTNLELEYFDIVGVEHELVEDGSWNVSLSVIPVLDGELSREYIETNLRYYDPISKEYVGENAYQQKDTEMGDWWPYW